MCTDAGLVMAIKAGNKKALGKLVDRHKKLAYRLALARVGNRDDAFDISQEAFLRVYRSARTYDDSQPFMPWFYTIIRNLCTTWLRRRQNRDHKMVDVDDISYLLVDDNADPERAYAIKEDIARLRRALASLPFQDREILTMQHFMNMSYDEIAKVLNVPRGTVMSRLYYARKKLVKLMRLHDE